jgi:hypothetical protein
MSISETNLVSRVKIVAAQPLSPDESADLTTVPNYHNARTALIVVGVAVAGGLIGYHEYENGLNNEKASQDAFCKANNIPLSECAGG